MNTYKPFFMYCLKLGLGFMLCLHILFSQQQVYLGDYNDEITNVSDVVLVVNEIMGG